MSAKLFKQILRKKLTAGISLVLIITGGYFGYQALTKDNDATRYVTAAAEKGTLIVSLSGSGQVSASSQVDIKPKVSGDVVYVGVKNGQEVKAGTVLVQIDSSNAQKAVRDAQTSLETAKLELAKLLEPIDELDLLKAENNLAKAKESKQQAEDNIIEGYEDAFNAVANAFLDLPTLITGLHDILYNYDLEKNYWNMTVLINSMSSYDYGNRDVMEKFINSAETAYKTARTKYDDNFENYKDASRYSDKEVIEALLNETLETTKAAAEAVKNETNMLDYWVDYRSGRNLPIYSKVTEYQANLKTYTSKTNSQLTSLLNIQRSLQDNREAVLNAQRSIEELELSLAELKAGADELDIRAKKIAIQQKEDALFDAQQNLADHYIRVPFDGIIAGIDVKKGESVSSNAIATLITKQKIAEISLNEVDAAKVKTGQKATLAFDAVEDLTITGEVIEIDTIGTVSQGVVTYNVKIAFDTQPVLRSSGATATEDGDERIKPGMSLSAAIITDIKQNTLLVPNSAIKQGGGIFYVEIMTESGIPQQQVVAVGLSNDTMTEITSGIEQGDKVVTQTINATETGAQSKSQNSRGFMIPGMGGGPR